MSATAVPLPPPRGICNLTVQDFISCPTMFLDTLTLRCRTCQNDIGRHANESTAFQTPTQGKVWVPAEEQAATLDIRAARMGLGLRRRPPSEAAVPCGIYVSDLLHENDYCMQSSSSSPSVRRAADGIDPATLQCRNCQCPIGHHAQSPEFGFSPTELLSTLEARRVNHDNVTRVIILGAPGRGKSVLGNCLVGARQFHFVAHEVASTVSGGDSTWGLALDPSSTATDGGQQLVVCNTPGLWTPRSEHRSGAAVAEAFNTAPHLKTVIVWAVSATASASQQDEELASIIAVNRAWHIPPEAQCIVATYFPSSSSGRSMCVAHPSGAAEAPTIDEQDELCVRLQLRFREALLAAIRSSSSSNNTDTSAAAAERLTEDFSIPVTLAPCLPQTLLAAADDETFRVQENFVALRTQLLEMIRMRSEAAIVSFANAERTRPPTTVLSETTRLRDEATLVRSKTSMIVRDAERARVRRERKHQAILKMECVAHEEAMKRLEAERLYWVNKPLPPPPKKKRWYQRVGSFIAAPFRELGRAVGRLVVGERRKSMTVTVHIETREFRAGMLLRTPDAGVPKFIATATPEIAACRHDWIYLPEYEAFALEGVNGARLDVWILEKYCSKCGRFARVCDDD